MAWENVGEIGGSQFSGNREHIPVMPAEVLFWLRPRSQGIYLDCTVGYCGHALDILEASDPDGKVFGIDRDAEAVDAARRRLQPFGDRAVIIKGHFMELKRLLVEHSISHVEGVLFDLGASSPQFDDPARGFSFQSEGPLDMRMDRSGPTAADIVNGLDEIGLADMIYRWGEERYSRRIARALVRARQQRTISTTRELVSVIESAVPGHYRRGRIHCATRTFQALRIAVNKELDHLEASFRDAADVLAPGGRLCVISFHSLEDRIVKQSFKAFSSRNPGEFEVLTKRPQVPTEDEMRRNPRSRSAKLRVVQRIVHEGHA
jgi:16S rRNA (cytosine1402-N4)-methyltransferase